jgi:O-antigen ligase
VAFVLTLIYVALTHLSPAEVFPSIAEYHVMQWLAVVAALITAIYVAARPGVLRSRQTGQMFGLILAIGLSRFVHLWFGGVFPGMFDFVKSGIVFFMIVATVDSLRKLRILMTVLALVALGLLGQSLLAQSDASADSSRYVIHSRMQDGDVPQDLARIRSVGVFQDPNDFAQLLLVATSLVLIAWKPSRPFRDLLLVVAPAALLLYGAYLTHSRGALFGFTAFVYLLLRRRFSMRVAVPIGIVILAVLIGAEAVGSRAISFSEGNSASRLMAWGEGIAMFKSSPLFGVGYGVFEEHSDLTAHNSFVLCFAELGLFGYFFWLGLIIASFSDLNAVVRSAGVHGEHDEIVRYAAIIRIALATFLVMAWFLSRTYLGTFYVLIAMAVVIRRLAPHAVLESSRPRWLEAHTSHWLSTGAIEVASIVLIYVTLRLRAF